MVKLFLYTADRVQKFFVRFDIYLILLLAFVVRMIGIRTIGTADFPEFYRDYYMVGSIAHGSRLVLAGPPSMLGGFHFGPFYYYIMVPFYVLFGGHPFGLIFCGIVISVLTVYAVFRLVLLWSGSRQLGLLTATFCAISVYSLHLTSFTSNPNFLPLFVLWYFYHLTKIADGSSERINYALLGLAFGLASQLHVTAVVVLVPLTVIVMGVNRKRFVMKAWLVSAGVFLVTYIPYLMYEVQTRFGNLAHLFKLGAQNLHGGNSASGLLTIWNFFSGTLTPFNSWYTYTFINPSFLYIIVAVLAVVFLLQLVYRILWVGPQGAVITHFSKNGLIILITWVILVCLMLLVYSRAAHDHYIIVLWPAPMIILGLVCFWLRERVGVFRTFVALIIVTSLFQIYSFYSSPRPSWSYFFSVYDSQYKNRSDISEIGAYWK